MKTIPVSHQTMLDSDISTLCICCRIERSDGQKFGLTTAVKNITLDSVEYKSDNGIAPTAFQTNSGNAPNSIDLLAAFDALGIAKADLEAGLFVGARVYVFATDYANPVVDAIQLTAGVWSDVKVTDDVFDIQFTSLAKVLQQRIGRIIQPMCDAELGDSRCGFNKASITVSGTVTSVTDRQVFTDTARTEADNHFDFGLLTFTSGNNNGKSMEVAVFGSGQFTLLEALPYDIQIGDTYDLPIGCPKTLTACINTFNNAVNFRGFADIPGQSNISKFGGQQ